MLGEPGLSPHRVASYLRMILGATSVFRVVLGERECIMLVESAIYPHELVVYSRDWNNVRKPVNTSIISTIPSFFSDFDTYIHNRIEM